MNKRQRKKLSRKVCPVCRACDGIWHWVKTSTGRWVSEFCVCFICEDRKEKEDGKVQDKI